MPRWLKLGKETSEYICLQNVHLQSSVHSQCTRSRSQAVSRTKNLLNPNDAFARPLNPSSASTDFGLSPPDTKSRSFYAFAKWHQNQLCSPWGTNSFDVLSVMHCIKSLESQTCVLYNVRTFLHQSPNSVVNWISRSTGLFGGHRSREITFYGLSLRTYGLESCLTIFQQDNKLIIFIIKK